jgi:succinoglycan biosynthesis protein ExoV
MKAYHWQSWHGNFGDDLNLWLWDFLLPGFREVHADTLLVGIGTVLNRELLPAEGRKLVVGSGFGYGVPPDVSDPRLWDLRCVRGPLTAEKLGLDPALGVIDPAVMVAEMPEFRDIPKTNEVVFVPHWRSTLNGAWAFASKAAGLTYVSPCQEAKSVVKSIAQARLVVAESMHAAILADAFRIPWVAVTTSPHINAFKWRDWTASLGLAYEPLRVPVSSPAEAEAKGVAFWGLPHRARPPRPAVAGSGSVEGAILMTPLRHPAALRRIAKRLLALPSIVGLWQARRARPQLSADAVLTERKERLREILLQVRRDYL